MCQSLTSNKDVAETIDTGGIKECGIDKGNIKIGNIILGPAKATITG